MKVLVVAPVWNEEERIGEVIEGIPRESVDEILVIDDGSTDDSVITAREKGAQIIAHETNKGVGAAIRSGIHYGQKNNFDIIVIMSGGGKTPGEQIPRLIAPMVEDNYVFVQGSRYLQGGKRENLPLTRRVGTKGYSSLFTWCAGKKVTDGSSGFRAFRTSIFKDSRINIEQPWLDHYELEPYLYYKIILLKIITLNNNNNIDGDKNNIIINNSIIEHKNTNNKIIIKY